MADINLGVGGANSASGGYEIANSLKFESDNSEYLSKTFASAGNRKAWTWSAWVKRTELNSTTTYQQLFSAGTGNPPRDVFFFDDDTDDTLCFFSYGGLFSSATLGFRTNAFFRDTSAWYHIVLVLDTANSTAADRLKLYVNGVSQTFSTYNAPTQNADSLINSNTDHAIGRDESTNAQYFNGYMAEVNFVDGSALAPTDFGEYDDDSGIWKPKEYTGSYGTNGFYLDFEDSSSLGADDSGNSNNFTLNNIAAADQATDTPTNNFCTPLLIQPYNSTDSISHTEGGTKLTTASGTGWRTNMATMSLSSGKWYFEAKHPGTIDGDAIMTSIVPTARFGNSAYASFYGGQSSGDGLGFYWDSTRFRYDDGSTISPPTNSISSGDILSIALDMDNNYVYSRINGGAWHNNGSANGDPTSGSSGTGGFAVADEPHMICTSMYHPIKNFFVNFGGYNAFPVSSAASDANGYGTFEYAPPSGYYAICSKNLAEYG
jgi:hypothetical protein